MRDVADLSKRGPGAPGASETSEAPETPETALLAPDEPAPFALHNAGGRAPILLLCDHASAFVPRALKDLGLSEAELCRHIAWDIGIAEVTRDLARRLEAPALFSHFSRLVVDPNRALDDPTLIPQLSDGTIVPGNRGLSQAARQARVAVFHRAYHGAVRAQLEAMTARGPAPAILSMHSFTPVMKGLERPWQIGILWNRDGRLPVPLMARLRAQGLSVGDNEPYSGRETHGHTMHLHAEPRRLANALIEIRQDLIDTHHGAAEWSERLADTLRPVLADPRMHEEGPEP